MGSGNNMKSEWAQKELKALDSMPKYKYLVEAEAAGPNLKASTPIPEADRLYGEALMLQGKAEQLVIIKDNNLLRLALDKYDQVIRKYPSSDKIDDAAFKAGEIYDYFKDYTIALLYYQRAYQWNPQTTYPARFRAAFVLDKRLHRRAEALELYQQALEKEGQNYLEWKNFADRRIGELTKRRR
jgi:tetratricopeptide (TPR) repeat protein